jgi:hypothetical protein
LDSARLYGFVKTDIRVDVDRCVEILKMGNAKGYLAKPVKELCEIFLKKDA